jgi:hypothetical protein
MTLPRIAVVLLSLLVVCPAQQTGVSSGKIILRMLNGKTGKPIWRHDVTNIWLGDAKQFSLQRTDAKGEIVIVMDIGNIHPFEIGVMPSTYADCRFKGDQTSGRLVRYSLDDIISKGVVGENLCGKTRVSPTPGVLVVYVRRRTFIEGMKL